MNIARVNALTNNADPDLEESSHVKSQFKRRFTAHHIEGFNLCAAVAGPVLDQPHAVSFFFQINSHKILAIQQGNCCPFPAWEMYCWFGLEKPCSFHTRKLLLFEKRNLCFLQQGFPRPTSTCTWTCSVRRDFIATHRGLPCRCSSGNPCRCWPRFSKVTPRGYPWRIARILLVECTPKCIISNQRQ